MTIKEIAQICGVSRGTVDRVLNRRGKVKPEIEALVLRTMEEQGYTKNIAGKALTVKKAAPVIGAILCSEGNPFFGDVIAGFYEAEQELNDYGVTVILRTMRGHSVQRQLELIDEIADKLAVLVIQPINDPRIALRLSELKEKGVSTVTVNTDIANSCRVCYVGSDYAAGGTTAAGVMRLVTGGKATLGIITGVDTLMGHIQRQRGFEEHLHALCPDIRIVARESARDDMEKAFEVTQRVLRDHPDIDALFVVAAGVYGVCRAVEGERPGVKVLAFDDVPSTREMMQRGIVRAVVCQQPQLQGYRAVRAAFDIILTGSPLHGEMMITENQIKIVENL